MHKFTKVVHYEGGNYLSYKLRKQKTIRYLKQAMRLKLNNFSIFQFRFMFSNSPNTLQEVIAKGVGLSTVHIY